jgi:hypothetical protein
VHGAPAYEGRIVIPLHVLPGATKATLALQPCDESRCLPSISVEIEF